MNKTPEQLEKEADDAWETHFGPEATRAADTPESVPAHQAAPPSAVEAAPEAADTPQSGQATWEPEPAHGAEETRWEERYRNAQALMTRATQEAARLRNELAEAQRQQAAMLAEIERQRAAGAGPMAPPAGQATSMPGARQDTAPEDIDPKLRKLIDEDPDLVPLVEQNRSVRREIDQIRQRLYQSDLLQRERELNHARASHEAAVRAAHPDVDAIAKSPDFSGWVTRQPAEIQSLVNNGSTDGVVWLLSQYKAASGIDTNLEAARAAASPNTPRVRRPPTSQRPLFTRAQISAMSASEYARREQEIDDALAAGLIS